MIICSFIQTLSHDYELSFNSKLFFAEFILFTSRKKSASHKNLRQNAQFTVKKLYCPITQKLHLLLPDHSLVGFCHSKSRHKRSSFFSIRNILWIDLAIYWFPLPELKANWMNENLVFGRHLNRIWGDNFFCCCLFWILKRESLLWYLNEVAVTVSKREMERGGESKSRSYCP